MDEQIKQGLRWVLMTTESGWTQELAQVLGERQSDPEVLAEVQAFLMERIDTAAPNYQERMRQMVKWLDTRRRALASTSASELGQSVKAWMEATQAFEAVQGKMEAARAQLRSAQRELLTHLQDGQSVEFGGYLFTRRVGRTTLEVVEPYKVAFHFQRQVPDERALQDDYRRTGQPPTGTMVRHGDPELEVVFTGQADDD